MVHRFNLNFISTKRQNQTTFNANQTILIVRDVREIVFILLILLFYSIIWRYRRQLPYFSENMSIKSNTIRLIFIG